LRHQLFAGVPGQLGKNFFPASACVPDYNAPVSEEGAAFPSLTRCAMKRATRLLQRWIGVRALPQKHRQHTWADKRRS